MDADSRISDRPTVSVVIPVYNDAERLQLGLTAVLAQDYPSELVEVIVVNNASDDDPRPAIPADPRVQLVHEGRRGSYAARNRGVREATGEVLAFTDSDCLPRPDWLRRGVDALTRDPRPDAVGGAIRIFFADGPDPVTGPELFEARHEFQQRKYVEEWSFAATANLLVPRAVFDEVGGFDLNLQSGGDLDFGTRLREVGRRLVYAGDVVVDHPARSTWRELGLKTVRVATGIADRARGEGRRSALLRAAHEARPGITIWVRVWQAEAPAGFRSTLRYAAAVSYVQLLRASVHVRRALRG